MNINQEEQATLYKQKTIIEQKDSQTANKEIKRDIDFEKALSRKNKEIDKLCGILKKQDSQIHNLKKEIGNLKTRLLNKGLQRQIDKINRDTGNYATTKELWRIISALESSNEKMGLNELSRLCVLNNKPARDNALSFLIKTKIINQINEKGRLFFERC